MSPESHSQPPSPSQHPPAFEDTVAAREITQQQLQPHDTAPTHHPSAPSDELFDIPTTVDPSYIISLIRKLVPGDDAQGDDTRGLALCSPVRNGDAEVMDIQNDDLKQSPGSSECPEKPMREVVWEESGCILWDLAANKEHAEFMVQNLVVDVLLANLQTSNSARVTEISLGIIGNLACHEVVMSQIITTDRFLVTVAHQVFSDDTPCLCEVSRLLTLGLQGSQSIAWAKALQSDNILSRILWITENTLNPMLIEKSVALLLAILENQQVVPVLLPILIKLGLPTILVNLLAFEMGKLTDDRMPERYLALDLILRTIEALSVIDGYSEEICLKRELSQMAVELIKIPEKTEISSSCVTAAVLIANILSDAPDMAMEMSNDLILLQSLLDLFPFTSDDFDARNALWSILTRLLVRVQEFEMRSFIHQYVWILVSRSDLIEDALLDSQCDKSSGNNETSGANLSSKTAAIKSIINVLNQWKLLKEELSERHNPVLYVDDKNVQKLLDCCYKHDN